MLEIIQIILKILAAGLKPISYLLNLPFKIYYTYIGKKECKKLEKTLEEQGRRIPNSNPTEWHNFDVFVILREKSKESPLFDTNHTYWGFNFDKLDCQNKKIWFITAFHLTDYNFCQIEKIMIRPNHKPEIVPRKMTKDNASLQFTEPVPQEVKKCWYDIVFNAPFGCLYSEKMHRKLLKHKIEQRENIIVEDEKQ